jgi:hypothetical protein
LKALVGVGVVAAAGILAIVVLLVRLERRSSEQAAELKALRLDLASGHSQSASESSPVAAPPIIVRNGIDSDAIYAIASAVARIESRNAGAAAESIDAGAQMPPRTVEQETAMSQASDVVAEAITHGRLSREDVLRVRENLRTAQATQAERDALRSQIAMAINAQKLRFDDPRVIYP